MSNNFFKVKKGLNIDPVNPTTITPEIGDVIIDSTDSNKLKKYNGSSFVSLENKVAESGGTLTNGSIVTPSRLDVKQDTFANLQTYAATASNGQLVFATDLKQTYQIIDGTLKVVGGAGGINYISNSDFESDTNATLPSGYARYANAAATAIPETGTGGSPNAAFTFLATTTTPLRGTKSALISKDANSRLGHGVSYNFTIDAADQAQILRISFDFNSSANYADGDITVYVYDVTNSRLIEVIDRDLLASSKGKFVGTFQTSPDSLSYRLIFHVASANALAYTVEIDNIIVGPQTIVKGAIVTDSKSTTLTSLITGVTTNPTFGTLSQNELQYSRRGENLLLRGSLLQTTAGTAGSGNYVIDLPDGLVVDLTKVSSGGSGGMGTVGSCLVWDGVTYYTGIVTTYGGDPAQLGIWFGDETLSPTRWSSTTVPFSSTNLRISFSAEVPITGWSSNVVLSEDAGNREIYARLDMNNVNQNGTAIGQTLVALSNASEDTTNSFDSATSLWTCPESGLYDIIGSIYATGVTTTDNNACSIRINGSGVYATFNQPGNSTAANTIVCSITSRLQKGDTVGLAYTSQTDAAYVINGNTGRTFLSIAKRSSPQTIAASEVVTCRYTSNSGLLMVNGTNTPLTFNLKEFDTHNAFDGTTFTAPQSGYYQICENVQFGGNTAGVGLVRIFGTTSVGTSIQGDYFGISGSIQSATMSKIIYLPKGGTIATSILQSNGANRALVTDSSRNSIEIIKVG